MNRSVLSVPMFQALGYSFEESQVLLHLLDKGLGTIDELESETQLTITPLQNTLQKLQDEGLVELVNIEPQTYAVTPKFARESVSQTEKLYKAFITEVEAIVSTKEDLLDEIKKVFMSLGYVIKAPLTPSVVRVSPLLRRVGLAYDFIAESYYSIGVMLLNQDKWSLLEERFSSSILVEVTNSLEQQNNCLTSIIFLGPDIQRPGEAISSLEEMLSIVRRWSRERGIEKQPFYALSVSPDMERQVRSLVGEIRQKRKIVESVYREIETALAEIDDVVTGIETMGSLLGRFLSGEEPFLGELLPDIGEMVEPVQSALSREMRNHRLFRRQYEEEGVQIRRWWGAFESRIYLPEIDTAQDSLNRIQALREKFLPIQFELRTLFAEFATHTEEGEKWNPFMFTEPYEPKGITINQEPLKKQAQRFVDSIRDGLPGNISFVMGNAGIGKTHMLKYVYVPMLRENDIWPIYVDCPVKYDLVKGVCQEILQDRNFPEGVLGHLRGLREKDYSTTLDMVDLILKINALLVKTHNAKGVVVLLDELENTVPYKYYTDPAIKQRVEEEPLALRQLREILRYDYRERIGFVIAFRKQALPMVEQSLQMTNFRDFLEEVKQLGLKDVKELILHRYKTWSAKEVSFSDACLKAVVEITEGVTRNIIRYCRQLYKHAIAKKYKTITRGTLKQIEPMPLFKY